MSTTDTKERHNLTLSSRLWTIVKEINRLTGKSISKIIEEATWKFVEKEGYNRAYFKLMTETLPCSDKENEELTKILNSLGEEDLEVVEEKEIEI